MAPHAVRRPGSTALRVLVVGVSGWLGGHVVAELRGAGHEVTGLTASSPDGAGAPAITARGWDAVALLDDGAAAVRPTLLLAGAALTVVEGHDTRVVPCGSAPDESAISVMRLAPSVHAVGAGGFVATLMTMARCAGFSAYPLTGSRWHVVSRCDAARLVRASIETVPPGTVLHAVDDVGTPVREVADAVGRRLDLPVRAVDNAASHFGFLAHFLDRDVPGSNTATREIAGWTPTGAVELDVPRRPTPGPVSSRGGDP